MKSRLSVAAPKAWRFLGFLNDLPRELWFFILQQLNFPEILDYAPVCSLWRSLVYESITSFNSGEGRWLTDGILKRFVSLQHLQLGMYGQTCRLTDASVSSLVNLTSLAFHYCHTVTNKSLMRLTKLTTLDISSSRNDITDIGIKGLNRLTQLDLCDNNLITNHGLRGLSNLTSLGISYNSSITDYAIGRLTNLRVLDLYENSTITDEGIKGLVALTSLNLGGHLCKVTDVGIVGLVNLISLSLYNNSKITDRPLQGLFYLAILSLGANHNITNDGISNLTQLTSLDVTFNTKISDAGVIGLTNLTSLR
jgi:Leucine-rich repeat (LRR) protein